MVILKLIKTQISALENYLIPFLIRVPVSMTENVKTTKSRKTYGTSIMTKEHPEEITKPSKQDSALEGVPQMTSPPSDIPDTQKDNILKNNNNKIVVSTCTQFLDDDENKPDREFMITKAQNQIKQLEEQSGKESQKLKI